MFNKILIALDTEEACAPLFEKALTLAQATGSDLVLLGVLSPTGDGTLPLLSYPEMSGYPLTRMDAVWDVYQDRYSDYKKRGFEKLSGYLDQAIAAGVQAEIKQETGDPGRVICDVAKAETVGLIIVGSHGRKGLDEFLMGSVSSYVMHRAPCSVLVVHKQALGQMQPAEEPALSSAN